MRDEICVSCNISGEGAQVALWIGGYMDPQPVRTLEKRTVSHFYQESNTGHQARS
jgi:microcystin degradation protein MlrC